VMLVHGEDSGGKSHHRSHIATNESKHFRHRLRVNVVFVVETGLLELQVEVHVRTTDHLSLRVELKLRTLAVTFAAILLVVACFLFRGVLAPDAVIVRDLVLLKQERVLLS